MICPFQTQLKPRLLGIDRTLVDYALKQTPCSSDCALAVFLEGGTRWVCGLNVVANEKMSVFDSGLYGVNVAGDLGEDEQ